MHSSKNIRSQQGLTLIELLLTVTVIGILAAIGFGFTRGTSPRLLANDVRAMVQQARFEAIKRNVPVKVVWSENPPSFLTLANNPGNNIISCDARNTKRLGVKRVSDYRNVKVFRNAALSASGFSGIVWLPSGLSRSCSGAGASNSTTVFRSGGSSIRLVISRDGRVRLE